MAIEFIIKQKGLFKKELTLETIINVLGDKYRYGIMNEIYVLQDLNDINDYRGKYIIFYNPNKIGRGFEITIQPHEITLNQPLFCTRSDLDNCYSAVKELCTALKTSTYLQDGVEKNLSTIVDDCNYQKNWNQNYLYDTVHSDEYREQTIFGAVYPVTIESNIFLEKEYTADETDELFESYMHDKQSRDVYYAKPLLRRHNETQEVKGIYVLTEDVTSVVPKTPRVPFTIQLDEDVHWCVAFVCEEDGEFNSIGELDYQTFIELFDIYSKERFDASNYIVTLSKKDMKLVKEEVLKTVV